MVIAVQSVTKSHLLRDQKCWRSVINLQVPGVRRKLEVTGCCEFLSVDNDGFNVCLCWQGFLRQPCRIHHLQDKTTRNPYPPIRRHSGRIERWSPLWTRAIQYVIHT